MELSYTHLFYLMSFACSERCSKCGHWRIRPVDRPLPSDLLADAFAALPGLSEFCIVGGEPLVFKDSVLALIEAARQHPFRTVIVTNGVLLTQDFVRQITGNRVHVVVSIDTVDPAAWRWIRGRDTCERVLRNLHTARAHLSPEQLSIQSVLAAETRDLIPDVASFCDRLGLHHSVQDYLSGSFGGSWTPLPADQQACLDDRPCIAAGRNVSILPNGDVVFCFQQRAIPACGSALGNLKTASMSALLSTDYARQVQAAMRKCGLPCRVLRCNQD